MTSESPLLRIPWVRPRQERSRQTLTRLLDATEELLAEESLDQLGIRRITTAAGCAVGSFYNYFADRDQLLEGLLLRFQAESDATVAAHRADAKWQDVPLAGRVASLVDLAHRVYSERRGLIRAVDIEVRRRGFAYLPKGTASAVQAHAIWHEFLLERRAEITAPDPLLAVRMGMTAMLELMRLYLFYPDRRRQLGLNVSRKRFLEEASRSLLATLAG